MIALGHYFKVGKLNWADAGGTIVVHLFDGSKFVFAGYILPGRLRQLLDEQVELVDLYFRSETISAVYVEIPKGLLELQP